MQIIYLFKRDLKTPKKLNKLTSRKKMDTEIY